MKILKNFADEAVLLELGARLERMRLAHNFTQAELAEKAGVAKRTIERMEAGGPTQLLNLVRIARALDLIENIDALVPEPVTSPLALLKLQGRQRQRASSARSSTSAAAVGSGTASARARWTWRDDTSSAPNNAPNSTKP
jgi:putative transcriptional regulator